MEIFTLSMLLHWLDGAVVRLHQGCSFPSCVGGIRLLDGLEEQLCSDFLYLADPATAAQAAATGHLPGEGVLIVSSSGPSPWADRKPPRSATLVETSLPLVPLYNRLQQRLHQFFLWKAQMQEAVYTNSGVQALLEQSSSMLPATLLLLNPGYKHIAAVYHPQIQDSVADEVRRNGYLSFDTLRTTRHQTPLRGGKEKGFVEFVSMENQNYIIIRDITYQDTLAAWLLVIRSGTQPDQYCSDLAEITARYIAQFMFSNQGVDYNSNAAFGSLVSDLIEFRLTDPEELQQRLRQFRLAVRRYYHTMIVSFGDRPDVENIPWNYIISLLERIFPFSNATTYRGEILLIIRKTQKGYRLRYNEEALEQLLKRYNGKAAFGNFSEFLTSMPTMYYQTKSALRLGRVLDPDKWVYIYEDYSMYQMVEMAAQMLRQEMGSRNIVHLCHPALIAMVMDDSRTGSNLTDVLYEYLCCERNAALAAKRLYIHRNTMLYKIHKIEGIIGQSLDDPRLRERLLFSYRVLEYMRRYCKEDILLLKKNHLEESGS